MRTTTALALVALQAASTLAWNSTCKPGVGPCVGPEVVALESDECQKYHIFLARGSDSGYPGHQGPLAKLICDGLGDDCGYENIVYPANSSATGQGNWCRSAGKGAVNGQKQLTDYAKRCPDSKLIVSGYSQGASVMMDILGGGGGPGFDCDDQAYNDGLSRDESPGSNIVAALVFGTVIRSRGQDYTVEAPKNSDYHGDSPKNYDGKHPRAEKSLKALEAYSPILREYCNVGDPVCASGSDPWDIKFHLNYFDLYSQEAADWVVSKASGKKIKASPTSTASATPSAAGHKDGFKEGTTHPAATQSTGGNPKETDPASKASVMSASFGLSVLVVALGALFHSL